MNWWTDKSQKWECDLISKDEKNFQSTNKEKKGRIAGRKTIKEPHKMLN